MSASVGPWRRRSQARSWIAVAFGASCGRAAAAVKNAVDVWVASEVADDGPDGADLELKPLGEFVGGRAFEEVGAADLVAALGGGSRVAGKGVRVPGSEPSLLGPE